MTLIGKAAFATVVHTSAGTKSNWFPAHDADNEGEGPDDDSLEGDGDKDLDAGFADCDGDDGDVGDEVADDMRAFPGSCAHTQSSAAV